jgi:LPPG:FO 2-phospho-L-lactate transferase
MTPSGHILALAGGVGGAKLVRGLARVLDPGDLTVVVNTADDFEHLGLSISPDLDSVMYALAGLNDTERGWGLREETWRFMHALERMKGQTWFSLGDQDLATHVLRTERLRNGARLSEVTAELCSALGIQHTVSPMADQSIRTTVDTEEGPLPFQRYFVDRQCEPKVSGFRYVGAVDASMAFKFISAVERDDLAAIIICPSNPFISIDPILAVPGARKALRECKAPIVAVTPIVGGAAIKGPAAKMLGELGYDVSLTGITEHYGTLLDGMLGDETDADECAALRGLGVETADTLMHDDADRERVARAALALAMKIKG